MKLLVTDVGNQRIKYAVGELGQDFPTDKCCSVGELNGFTFPNQVDCCLVSSVNQEKSDRWLETIRSYQPTFQTEFLGSTNTPIELLVDHPEKLGADRVAGAYGGWLRNQTATIVVDSGTAVTVDRVNQTGSFEGGTIFPGLNLSRDQLVKGTAQLPRIESLQDESPSIFGRNTLDAIHAGIYWAHIGAVERIVENYRQHWGPTKVMLTGGNGRFLLNSPSIQGEFHPHLVLEGLWEIAKKVFG